MTNYKLNVQYSSRFKKSLKKVLKQGKDIEKLLDIVDKIANCEELEPSLRNHKLIKNKYYVDCYECHIELDWLLIYKCNNEKLILLLVDTGSHGEMF